MNWTRWKQILDIGPVPRPSLELSDDEAFGEYTRELNARNIRSVALFIVALSAVTSIPDPIVFAEMAEIGPRLVWIRGALALIAVAAYLGLRSSALAHRPMIPGFFMAMSASVVLGYMLGRQGGLETPWFHFTYPLVICVLVPVVPLHTRALLSVAFPACLLAGLALARPDLPDDPMLAPTVGYLIFVMGVGLVTGHVIRRLVREAFLRQREQKRTARELAQLNGTLEKRVRAQTHELRMLMAHLESAREDERARIARELHDELGQELTAMRYTLTFLKQRYERDPTSIRSNIDELDSLLSLTAKTTRHIVSELRPRVLDDLGLDAGVEWLIRQTEERSGLRCTLSTSCQKLDLHVDVSIAAFRILQESLTNMVRHAKATQVDVEVTMRDDDCHLTVRDNGVGLRARPPSEGAAFGGGGMGLLGIRERVDALGGELRIESAPGKGTSIQVRLPRSGRRAVEEVTP